MGRMRWISVVSCWLISCRLMVVEAVNNFPFVGGINMLDKDEHPTVSADVIHSLEDIVLYSIHPHVGVSTEHSGVTISEPPFEDVWLYDIQRIAGEKQVYAGQDTVRVWIAVKEAWAEHGVWNLINRDEDRRIALADLLIDFMHKHEFYGLHLDCDACWNKQMDHIHYYSFIKLLCDKMRDSGKKLAITMLDGHTLPRYLYNWLDRIYLRIFFPEMGPIHDGINTLLENRCPSRKIFICVSLSAYKNLRFIEEEDSEYWGYDDIKPFKELVADLEEDGKINQLHTLQKHNDWRWESPHFVREKGRWANAQRLGGMFLYDITDDAIRPYAQAGIILESLSLHKVYDEKTLGLDGITDEL